MAKKQNPEPVVSTVRAKHNADAYKQRRVDRQRKLDRLPLSAQKSMILMSPNLSFSEAYELLAKRREEVRQRAASNSVVDHELAAMLGSPRK